MSPFAYRPSKELAAALLEYQAAERAFRDEVIAWDVAHPGTELMWSGSGFSADRLPCGFADGHDDVPAGLSRAKSRNSLWPVRGTAGEPWRKVLAWASKRPKVEPVLRRFDVRTHGDGPGTGTGGFYIAPTKFIDGGPDGVVVYCKYDLSTSALESQREPLSPHLTPMPLSEFYRIKERLEAEQAGGAR